MLAAAAELIVRAGVLRDPHRRRRQARRAPARRWSSTTSAPRTGCSSTRCAGRRSRSTRRPSRCSPRTPSLRRAARDCWSVDLPARHGRTTVPGDWGLWFDLWAQAFRHPEVKKDRAELDQQWRDMIARVGARRHRRRRDRAGRRRGVRDHVGCAARRARRSRWPSTTRSSTRTLAQRDRAATSRATRARARLSRRRPLRQPAAPQGRRATSATTTPDADGEPRRRLARAALGTSASSTQRRRSPMLTAVWRTTERQRRRPGRRRQVWPVGAGGGCRARPTRADRARPRPVRAGP